MFNIIINTKDKTMTDIADNVLSTLTAVQTLTTELTTISTTLTTISETLSTISTAQASPADLSGINTQLAAIAAMLEPTPMVTAPETPAPDAPPAA